jgi:hypothetical protein
MEYILIRETRETYHQQMSVNQRFFKHLRPKVWEDSKLYQTRHIILNIIQNGTQYECILISIKYIQQAQSYVVLYVIDSFL